MTNINRILVIQLARFGDFLQTTPLLAALKFSYPRAHLSVMVSAGQKGLAADNPDVDQVIPVDLSTLESLSANPDIPLSHKLLLMHRKLGPLQALSFDLILNLNMSRVAALLSELPQAGFREGPRLATDRRSLQPAPWNFFIMNLMSRRRLIRFNLVDLLSSYAANTANHAQGLQYRLPAETSAAPWPGLGDSSSPGPLIGFQLGSRHRARQWPAEHFAALAALLAARHQAKIVFLGTEQEHDLGHAVRNSLSQQAPHLNKHLIDLMGRTSIPELAGVLSQLDALVTTDTGTMHLAAAIGTPILGLFLGPAYCHETGPYGAGHLILQVDLECSPCLENNPECQDHRCGHLITPEHALAGIQWLLHKQQAGLPEPSRGIQTLVSSFDKFGVVFKPLIARSLTMSDVWSLAYRETGRGFIRPGYHLDEAILLEELSGFKPPLHELPEQLSPDWGNPDTAPLLRIIQHLKQHGLVAQADRIMADATRVFSLACQAHAKPRTLQSPPPDSPVSPRGQPAGPEKAQGLDEPGNLTGSPVI
jgi:ADP-heptose:LPS heptosyltransferase